MFHNFSYSANTSNTYKQEANKFETTIWEILNNQTQNDQIAKQNQ